MTKSERELRKLAKQHGLEVVNGSKHFKVYDATGRLLGVYPHGTVGGFDRNGKALRAALRRAQNPT